MASSWFEPGNIRPLSKVKAYCTDGRATIYIFKKRFKTAPWKWAIYLEDVKVADGRDHKLPIAKYQSVKMLEEMKLDNKYPYDIFKHGHGVTVFNTRTLRTGVVVEIKETAPEWIVPIVQYVDGGDTVRENASALMFVDDGRKLNLRGKSES